MFRAIFLLAMIAAVGTMAACTTISNSINGPAPLEEVKQLLDSRFTYMSNREKWGTDFFWKPGETGDRPFSGNCVNYAEAAVYQLRKHGIPAREWLVKTEADEFHMVACAQGWCIDNRRHMPFSQRDFSYHWIVDATPTR